MEVAEPWARQPRTLPVDLLLDIIARCDGDAKTVVRCGLVCKALRAAMLDPGFHARLGRRAGFDPGLLVAVSYRLSGNYYYENIDGTVIRNDPIAVQPSGRLPRFDTSLLRTFQPAASSRDGLLVLSENNEMIATGFALDYGLRVCNTITGHVTSLPGTSIGLHTSGVYQPALLSVDDDAVRSFKLLVMCSKLNGQLLTRTFSSQEGEWGAAREVHFHNNLPRPGVQGLYEASSTAPVVVGRSVHWLCYTNPVSADRELIIFAVRAESACANVIKLPQELHIRMGNPSSGSMSWWASYAQRFMLAATVTAQGERRLSFVAAEPLVISMWTLELHPDEGSSILWSRQEVILRQEIHRPLTSVLHANQTIRFSMFGERSGTVLFWMLIGEEDNQAILVQLNLVTKKTLVLWKGSDDHCCNCTAHALLHETSLISVLKSF